MIIECPACQSRYRIREEKLPAAGGNIKCPSCAHVFFVSRNAGPVSPAPPVTNTGASGQTDPNGWSQIPLGDSASPPAPAPAAAAPSASGTLAMAAVSENSPPRVVPQSPPTSAEGGPKKWKLRNAVGLVYDFTDTEQLVKWLGTKESHEGMQASEDGGITFRELSEFSALRDVRPSRKTMMGLPAVVPPPVNAGSPGASPATKTGEYTVDAQAAVATATGLQATAAGNTANAARPADQAVMQQQAQARLDQARKARGADVSPPLKTDKPAARASGKSGGGPAGGKSGSRLPSNNLRRERSDEGGSWLGLIGVLSIPLVIAGIVQVTGLFDFRQLLGGPREQVGVLPLPGNTLPAVDQSADQNNYVQPVNLSPAQQAVMAIDAAAAAVAQERFEEATGHLERAAFLAPERIELQCQLADLYERTSRPADAARTRARCDGTDAAAGSGAALPADGSAPVAEGSTANPVGSPAPETGPN
jgi:predicted Zn finger-like uncharacterized protein